MGDLAVRCAVRVEGGAGGSGSGSGRPGVRTFWNLQGALLDFHSTTTDRDSTLLRGTYYLASTLHSLPVTTVAPLPFSFHILL